MPRPDLKIRLAAANIVVEVLCGGSMFFLFPYNLSLIHILRQNSVTELYVAGLATDYCVKATVIDALELGFNTWLVKDACRGVNQSPGDVAAAIDAMQNAGARIVESTEISA